LGCVRTDVCALFQSALRDIVTQPSNGTTIASPPATETTMLRDCPTDAKATLALIALSAICILGWLADLGL